MIGQPNGRLQIDTKEQSEEETKGEEEERAFPLKIHHSQFAISNGRFLFQHE